MNIETRFELGETVFAAHPNMNKKQLYRGTVMAIFVEANSYGTTIKYEISFEKISGGARAITEDAVYTANEAMVVVTNRNNEEFLELFSGVIKQ